MDNRYILRRLIIGNKNKTRANDMCTEKCIYCTNTINNRVIIRKSRLKLIIKKIQIKNNNYSYEKLM